MSYVDGKGTLELNNGVDQGWRGIYLRQRRVV